MKLPRDDDGFSLVETLTAIAIMGVVMTALTTFFVSTTNTINKERGLQMAIRLASDGIELVKSLPGSTLAVGRSTKDVINQLNTDIVPNLDLSALATTMTMVVDPTLPLGSSSVNPVLPVLPEELKVNDAVFQRHWFVGSCVMDPKLVPGAPCLLSTALANPLSYFRVVVAVTWQNSRACAGGQCSYVTDTLVASSSTDPVFNPSVTVAAPLPDNPGNQASDVGVPVLPLQVTATSSYPPLTWSAEGLPAGVTINDAGRLSGTPTTPGTYVVRLIVKDNASTNDASFNWVVNPVPKLVIPDQTFDAGSTVAYQVPAPGGTGPLAWTAVGLPAGLTIDPLTGIIKGSTTATGPLATANVVVTVVDAFAQRSTVTFKWNTKVQVVTRSLVPTRGTVDSEQLVAAGGTAPYTFSASNLPTGLSVSPSGAVTGAVSVATRFLATVNVTDSKGVTNSITVPVNVTAKTGLTITAPAADTADRTSPKGTALTTGTTITAASSGGSGAVKWSLTQALPTGLSLNATTGAITGTPTAAGTWVVVLKATDATNATATFAFTWTVV